MITAKVILDSIDTRTKTRLTTVEYKLPKCLLAQLNTHRVFSRLARSSRAIKLEKILKEPAYFPSFLGKEGLGMKSHVEVDNKDYVLGLLKDHYKTTLGLVEELHKEGLHREYLNRYLEPFSYVTGLISSTTWKNFFNLRCSGKGAQTEISILADKIKKEVQKSIPIEREVHLPYILQDEENEPLSIKIIKSVARCARVSYSNHGTKYKFKKDYQLFRNLYENKHMSPFEMVAFLPKSLPEDYDRYNIFNMKEKAYYSNNYRDWIQLRANPWNLLRKAIKEGEKYV